MFYPLIATAIAIPLAIVIASDCQARPSSPRDEVAYYTSTYGELRPEQDPLVAVAHKIYERVRLVADKNARRLPHLVVVNSRSDPWAVALPKGDIVLSKQALEICFHGVDNAEAEARVAFVLGHEMAHLAHDDFWYREAREFLGSAGVRSEVLPEQYVRLKERELAADDQGFIYAAMAGYPVQKLLTTDSGRASFFQEWLKKTNSRVGANSASPTERATVLQRRLQKIADALTFFDFGVRLSHFGYCDDAIPFFREFQKVYSGHEVLNNLGYCKLQLAIQAMDADRAYFYWLPSVLDSETRSRALFSRTRGGKAIASLKSFVHQSDGKVERLLSEALDYFRRASMANTNYSAARTNLAVTLLYLGQPLDALAAIKETGAHDSAQELEALALYESAVSTGEQTLRVLQSLTTVQREADGYKSAFYNMARISSVIRHHPESRSKWNQLVNQRELFPVAIRTIVCQMQEAIETSVCLQMQPKPAKTARASWPFSTNVPEFGPTSDPAHQGWHSTPFDFSGDRLHGHIYKEPGNHAQTLELDHFTQMQVLRVPVSYSQSAVADYCPQKLYRRVLAQGVVLSCGSWAFLDSGSGRKEIWAIAD